MYKTRFFTTSTTEMELNFKGKINFNEMTNLKWKLDDMAYIYKKIDKKIKTQN